MPTETETPNKWQKINEEAQLEETNLTEVNLSEKTEKDLRDPAIIKLETELAEAQEKLLRAHAEYDNFRRRADRDIDNAHKFSIEKIIKALLPVVDSLEKSLEIEKDEELLRGVQMTLDIMLSVLEKHHIKAVDPKGELFNPSLHEAMATEFAPELQPNTVIKVFQKGYLLHERLLRPAFVVVSKAA